MKRSLSLAFVVALTIASAAWAGDSTSYGDGVTLDAATAIVELLENPESYTGEKVRVDGVVTSVCKKRGCWMQITDADTGKGIRIKVEDGVIVFPATAVGHTASAEGVFELVHVVPGQGHGYGDGHGDGHGEGQGDGQGHGKKDGSCDGAGSEAADAGRTILLIRGTGAIID